MKELEELIYEMSDEEYAAYLVAVEEQKSEERAEGLSGRIRWNSKDRVKKTVDWRGVLFSTCLSTRGEQGETKPNLSKENI